MQIRKQEAVVAEVRQQSGEVLRAYYMGERDSIAMLFFSAGSLQELLMVWDFAEAIFQSDRKKLTRHQQELASLNEQREQLRQTELELAFLRHSLLEQRQRVIALQAELDERLAEQAEAQAVLAQIEALTEDWDRIGLPMFNRYMSTLAKAMETLPSFVQAHPDHLSKGRGSTFSFYMTDDELNQFLQEFDPMFDNLRFAFGDGKLQAFGREDDTTISMSGQYVVMNEPENHIRFLLERLAYNGFALPDTTAKDLEERYHLGFYPKQLMDGVTITAVQIEPGKLTIAMQINFSLWF
ncbi:hypothetical protein XYCOK13_08040 [Xylanibacillus composti]|uniref:Uncharacterized protein n=1 Tax=Xylanibacillus composti TaxID=1572762 RepID=A0A8J4M0M9_9BACL|nr:hypothetical protein [Xylanibacillus composti]GIQ67980.1 hypothetical protein XYCOK13_08040 [Xylanibacillus composti]